ncbi:MULTISPECIES: class I SAM-dependent DNA methyltransferase [unclassified Jeotgalibaca]|uniref:class I SAM-dependent DNA methyltransferase n=1 Tax=unclassified Jeotgalibaca TaxID=2621505 RepID=UPI003FD0DDE5
MSYQIFSYFYDKVMDQSVYDDWMAYIEKYRPNATGLDILELACGTGQVAVQLAKAGHHVTGFDLSEDMLVLAQERMTTEGVAFELLQGDMRELADIGQYDVCTCFSDSLCYLSEESDLEAVFEGVYANLNKDGLFLFDVHSLFQVDHVFPGYQYIYQDEKDVFLWESFEGETAHSVEHLLTFFVENEDGSFKRLQELHEERVFEIKIYKKLLEKAGFKKVEITADFGREAVTETSPRWFFACQK